MISRVGERAFELGRRHNAGEDSVGNIVNHDMVAAGSCVCLLLFRSLGYGLALGVRREGLGFLLSLGCDQIHRHRWARSAKEERGALSQAPELEISWHER